MNEEIEYAEMLEIPVSTVNIIRKNKSRAKAQEKELKEETISRVNERFSAPYGAYSSSFFESEEMSESENDGGMYENNENSPLETHPNYTKKHSFGERVLKAEFALSCALCLGIFLTNVWVKDSAINTFFRSLSDTKQTDTRTYADFKLSSILSEEDAELTLSPSGILSFRKAGCVYPAVDGTVETGVQNNDGTWTIKISHSDTFSEIISGLSYAACSVGSVVKSNIPVGYSDGNAEVQVSMYEAGALLNCFTLTENGELVWAEE